MIQLYDPYGQLTAGVIAMQMHHDLNRNSGRTSRMMAAAKETGGIIIANGPAANDIDRHFRRERGTPRDRVKVISVDPRTPEYIMRDVRHGPLYMDHSWLFEVFMQGIIEQSNTLRHIASRYPSPLESFDQRMYDYGMTNPFIKINGVP